MSGGRIWTDDIKEVDRTVSKYQTNVDSIHYDVTSVTNGSLLYNNRGFP